MSWIAEATLAGLQVCRGQGCHLSISHQGFLLSACSVPNIQVMG